MSVYSNKGILTYLKSFKKNFCKIRKIKLDNDFSDDGDKFLVESLDNAINQKVALKEIRFSFLSGPLVYSLSLFSVFVTMSSLLIVYTNSMSAEAKDFQSRMTGIEMSPHFKVIASILLEYPHVFFSGLVGFITVFTILLRSNDFLLGFPLVSDIFRNLYTLKKAHALSILYGLGGTFIYLGMNQMYNLLQ